MPLTGAASAAPSYSSTRVQKAYRLNGIESIRLQWRLQLLDRQRVRAVRLVNQDIRLTRVALEHIHISSGVSVDEHEINVDTKSELAAEGPMFLYGERQVSRKQGKARRIQSAVAESSRRRTPNVDAARRPQTAALSTTFADVRARAGSHLEVVPLAGDDVDSAVDRLPSANGIARSGFFHAVVPPATRESGPHLPPSEGQIAAADDRDSRQRLVPRAKTAAGRLSATAVASGARPATAARSPLLPSSSTSAGTEASLSKAIHETATVVGLDKTVKKDEISRPGISLRNETAAESDRSPPTPAAAALAPPSPSLARPPSRAEQTAEAVKQARALSGRAKRFRNSVISDPLLDKTLPIAEKKRKRKEALLQQRRSAQLAADLNVTEKVRKYLVQHPLSGLADGVGTSAGSDNDGDDSFDEADGRRPAGSRSRLGSTVESAPPR